MRVHGEVVDMYYGLPMEERLPPPPSTEIAPAMDIQPQPTQQHRLSLEEYHIAYQDQPEKQDAVSVPRLSFEEPSPENAQVQRHGFFTDLPPGNEIAQALPSITAVAQSSLPVASPGGETVEIASPKAEIALPEAGVAPPAIADVAQPTEAAQAAPITSHDAPFSAPPMEWDATR
jgi:hypothetical protein